MCIYNTAQIKIKGLTMLIHSAIKKAKAQEAEKVAISLKVPIEVKTKLQKIADENNISLNNLCASVLENILDGELDDLGTMKLIEELEKARESVGSIQEVLNRGVGFVDDVNGVEIDLAFEEKISLIKVNALLAELTRRGVK